jgi:drug/metabolite transporter (DMT)-like permease
MLILNFGLVYVFWGSTYLGIDIAVEHIPPALMCATRFTIAGLLMLAYCLVSGKKVRYTARELFQLAVVGNLLLLGGNLTLSYAERYIPSGLAALLVASIPLWFLLLDSLMLGHHRVSSRGLAGLALGFVGTLVMAQH